MLFSKDFKAGIRAGQITRSYRAWKRPQAKIGGRYNLAPDGIIEVLSLSRVSIDAVSNADAVRAGFDDLAALRAYLQQPAGTEVYQIDFRYAGSGQHGKPASDRLPTAELADLSAKLSRMDQRADAPWTARALSLISRQPGTRAADLAPVFGWETADFKRQIRKLKALGLTLSLETGYRLSARGEQLLEVLDD